MKLNQETLGAIVFFLLTFAYFMFDSYLENQTQLKIKTMEEKTNQKLIESYDRIYNQLIKINKG